MQEIGLHSNLRAFLLTGFFRLPMIGMIIYVTSGTVIPLEDFTKASAQSIEQTISTTSQMEADVFHQKEIEAANISGQIVNVPLNEDQVNHLLDIAIFNTSLMKLHSRNPDSSGLAFDPNKRRESWAVAGDRI